MSRSRSLDTVYHLLDKRNWNLFQAHGLLSTTLLSTMSDADAVRRLAMQRVKGEQLSCGAYIRDQGPMPPEALNKCLRDGVSPTDWYSLINSKVFFWIDPKRLNRQRRACGDAEQIVLVIDARKMLEVYADRASVTPINTGNARRSPAARNLSTFVPYQSWVDQGWCHEQVSGSRQRPFVHKPVELTISQGVPDVHEYIIDMVHLPGGALL